MKNEVKPLTAIKPTGSMVLIELLTEQEMAGTKVYVGSSKLKNECPQGFILDVGPGLKEENLANWGFKVGDRVLVTGTFNPAPSLNKDDRELALMEPHAIKAVLGQKATLVT